ncbi:MAG: hypothetical protein JWO20_274, partial [Candidatus Angelobacter sp.]|nr:hypothetical protein [Candidatus Angelobacter sp.]
ATSVGPGHGFNNPPGIPASATSLTPAPRGFGHQFNGNGFNHGNRFNDGFSRFSGRGHGRGFGFGGIWPIYVSPYDYSEFDANAYDPNAYDPNAYDQNQYVNGVPIQQSVASQGPQTPTVIVIDSRGVHDATNGQQAALTPDVQAPAAAAVSAPAPVESGPTTLVVFRDGSRKELQSYAIVGKELVDVSGGRMRRYPLDDVDVKATTKENNDRGVDFRLPSNGSAGQ